MNDNEFSSKNKITPELVQRTFKRFARVYGKKCKVKMIPWQIIEPHKEQIKKNHHQTLETMQSMGGLSVYEAYCVMTNSRLGGKKDKTKNYNKLLEELVRKESIEFLQKVNLKELEEKEEEERKSQEKNRKKANIFKWLFFGMGSFFESKKEVKEGKLGN